MSSTNGSNGHEYAYIAPPHRDDAEEAVLGAILKYPPAVRQIADLIEARDFYQPRHQCIWLAIESLEADEIPVDYHMLGDRLHQQGTYDKVGGLLYLSEISLATPTAAHIVYYAQIVVRTAMLRRLISLSQGLAEAAWRDDKDPEVLMAEMERRLTKLSARATTDADVMEASAAADEFRTHVKAEIDAFARWDARRGPYIAGWRTGIWGIDKNVLGLKAGDLIYLAARTSVGKSVLAQQIALNVANAGGLVYYASLEMSRRKLMARAVTMTTGVARHEIERGNLNPEEQQKVDGALDTLAKLPLCFDTSSRSVEQVQHRAQRWADQRGEPLALIVVDYVQLLRDQAGPRSNRYENVSLASHNLKDMAERLHCTVFAPAQVSRDVLKRRSKMPDLSDLRESGDLEQDADLVFGLDRDDYHNAEVTNHEATLIILKARDLANERGRGTVIPLVWDNTLELYRDPPVPDNVIEYRRRPPLHDDLEAMRAEAEPEAEPTPPQGDLPF